MKSGDVYLSAYGRYVYLKMKDRKWIFDEQNKRMINQGNYKSEMNPES
ncbi:MAG: hypothetical protein R8G66_05255 [Cytophagales bacterium]|nr:hypothetical protein [Cytophagales bacterium]